MPLFNLITLALTDYCYKLNTRWWEEAALGIMKIRGSVPSPCLLRKKLKTPEKIEKIPGNSIQGS